MPRTGDSGRVLGDVVEDVLAGMQAGFGLPLGLVRPPLKNADGFIVVILQHMRAVTPGAFFSCEMRYKRWVGGLSLAKSISGIHFDFFEYCYAPPRDALRIARRWSLYKYSTRIRCFDSRCRYPLSSIPLHCALRIE